MYCVNMNIITVLTFHRHSPIIELHLSLCFRVEGNVLKDKEELFLSGQFSEDFVVQCMISTKKNQ